MGRNRKRKSTPKEKRHDRHPEASPETKFLRPGERRPPGEPLEKKRSRDAGPTKYSRFPVGGKRKDVGSRKGHRFQKTCGKGHENEEGTSGDYLPKRKKEGWERAKRSGKPRNETL